MRGGGGVFSQALCDNETELGSTINVWDWTQDEAFTFYLEGNVVFEKQSPFYLNSTIIPPNTGHLAFPDADRDIFPEDGWELLYKTFGTETDPVRVPSFAIYNRYEGIIKQFVLAPNNNDMFNWATNGVGVRNDFGTGHMLMGFSKYPIKSLNSYQVNGNDGFEMINEVPVGSISPFTTEWVLIEMPVMYDPCVCQYTSGVDFLTTLHRIESITLQGNSTGYSEAIYDSGVDQSPFLAGAKGFSEFDKSFKRFKETTDLKEYADSSGFNLLASVSGILSTGNLFLNVLDFLVGGGKEKPPTLIGYTHEHYYTFEGQANFTSQLVGNAILTSGSNFSGWPTELRPVYNNPLGVFALTYTPRYRYARQTIRDEDPFEDCQDFLSIEEKFQFDASSLRYTINTNAGIQATPVEMKGALKFNECYLLDHPEISFISELTRDDIDTQIYTTPLMDIECLENYTVKFTREYYDEPVNKGCEQRQEGGFCQAVDLVLHVKLLPENATSATQPVELWLTVELDRINEDFTEIPENPFDVEGALDCISPIPIMDAPFLVNLLCQYVYDPTIISGRSIEIDPEIDEFKKVISKFNNSQKKENEQSENQQIDIFPNPAQSTVFVNLPKEFADFNDEIEISVFDINGRMTLNSKTLYADSQERIEIGQLPDGTYAIEIANNTKQIKSVSLIQKSN